MNWSNDPAHEAQNPQSNDRPRLEPDLEAPRGHGGEADEQDILSVLGSIESQFQTLKKLRGEQEAAIGALERRELEVASRAEAVEGHERELAAREGQLREMESQQREMIERANALEAELSSREQGIIERERVVTERIEAAHEAERAATAALASLSERETTLAQREQELEQRTVALCERESAVQEAVRASQRMEREARALKAEGEALSERAALRESEAADQLAAMQRTLEAAKREAEEAVRRAGKGDAEQDRALRSALEEARAECARREAALAERSEAASRAEAEAEAMRGRLAEAEARCEELWSRIAQAEAQGATAGGAELDKRDLAIGKLRDQLAEANTRADQTTEELRKAMLALEQASASSGSGMFDTSELTKRDEAIEKLKAKLNQAKERMDRLARERDEARRSSSGAPEAGIGAQAEALRMRRARLKRQKELLAAQGQKIGKIKSSLETKQKQCEDVLALKSQLSLERAAVAKAVERAERRAAKNRAGVFMLTVVAMIAIIVGGSWQLSGTLRPGTYLAQMTVAMERDGASPEHVASWSSYLERLVSDPQMLEAAADRMKRRGILELANPIDLHNFLEENLDLMAGEVGRLTLTLKGSSAQRTERILETLASAYIGLANETRDLRMDRSATIVEARAQASSEPIEDPRMALFGMMAGGGSALALFGTAVAWRVLIGRKRKIESEIDAVDAAEAEAWAESVPAAASHSGRPI